MSDFYRIENRWSNKDCRLHLLTSPTKNRKPLYSYNNVDGPARKRKILDVTQSVLHVLCVKCTIHPTGDECPPPLTRSKHVRSIGTVLRTHFLHELGLSRHRKS